MKCIIPGPNVKVLGRAIHSLAKLGDDLYLEFTVSALSFRTANASKTAYAAFQFLVNFFSFYGFETAETSNSSLKCQISMKSSLSVFRSPATLDRAVDSLQIQLHSNSDKLVFLMKYKKGFIKTYHIPIIECESLKAHYLKENAPNKLIVQPKIVCDILSNFQNNQHEITWKVTKDNLYFRNYSENETTYSGVRTEITVEKVEFDEFLIENETEITFCLKELKAVLLFSDNVVLPLTTYFITSSQPIVFSVKGEVFEADIVISTLTGADYVGSEKRQSPKPVNNIAEEGFNQNENDDIFCNVELNEAVLLQSPEGTVGKNIDASNINDTSKKNKDKLKHVFHRCFDKQDFDVKELPGYNVVLASDSDADSEREN